MNHREDLLSSSPQTEAKDFRASSRLDLSQHEEPRHQIPKQSSFLKTYSSHTQKKLMEHASVKKQYNNMMAVKDSSADDESENFNALDSQTLQQATLTTEGNISDTDLDIAVVNTLNND